MFIEVIGTDGEKCLVNSDLILFVTLEEYQEKEEGDRYKVSKKVRTLLKFINGTSFAVQDTYRELSYRLNVRHGN